MDASSSDAVEKKGAEMAREYEEKYYAKCTNDAERVRKTLHDELTKIGIKHVSSSRAKEPPRLKGKIVRLGLTSHKIEDLLPRVKEESDEHKIMDVAGARISLYFPGDWAFVEASIFKEFKNVTITVHPEQERIQKRTDEQMQEETRPTRKRFDGYAARHYHVDMDGNEFRVELQVASALMHAWMEVEHDLIYKEAGLPLNAQELAAIDGLNGLTTAGEILLDGLKVQLLRRNVITVPSVPDRWQVAQNAAKESRDKFMAIGQNLFSLLVGKGRLTSTGADFKDVLIQCLKDNPPLHATIIIANIRNEPLMKRLEYGYPEFRDHLQQSIDAMKDLRTRADKEAVDSRLVMCTSNSVETRSFFLVDPDNTRGVAYLTYTSLGSRPEDRAIVTVAKQDHQKRFNDIYSTYARCLEKRAEEI